MPAYLRGIETGHNSAKYKHSERAGQQALNIAKLNGFPRESVYALANIDEALRMQLDLDLLLNVRPFIGKIKLLFLEVRFLIDRFRLEAWSHSATSEVDSAHRSSSAVILEHRIRLLAIVQGFLVRLGSRRVADWVLAKRWKEIRDESYRIGYAAGIGNALKFLGRVKRYSDHTQGMDEADGIDIVSARQVFDLIAHRTGQALILRDRADALARDGRFDDAAPLYEQAAHIAEDTSNSSLELKALLGLHSCGKAIDVRRVSLLADSIENDAQDAVKAAIVKRVTD